MIFVLLISETTSFNCQHNWR